MAAQALPNPSYRPAGCPACPPCAVPFAGTPPAAGQPFFAPLDEMSSRGQGRGRVAKSLLPGFPPFLPEDLVPGDEFMAFSGLGALTPEQKAWMQYGRGMNRFGKKEAQLSGRLNRLLGKKAQWADKHSPAMHGPVAHVMSGLAGFLGLAAGPDPNTMTCEKIIKGYEQNTLLAQSRGTAQHRANAATRVQELAPFYARCGGTKAAPQQITPDQPVDTHVLPGELGQQQPGVTNVGWTQPGTQPQAGVFGGIDMKQIGIVAGAGLAVVVLLAIVKKKKSKTA